jgi:hypothetical protein
MMVNSFLTQCQTVSLDSTRVAGYFFHKANKTTQCSFYSEHEIYVLVIYNERTRLSVPLNNPYPLKHNIIFKYNANIL